MKVCKGVDANCVSSLMRITQLYNRWVRCAQSILLLILGSTASAGIYASLPWLRHYPHRIDGGAQRRLPQSTCVLCNDSCAITWYHRWALRLGD